MPYLWDACRPCWLWSSVLEEEDGNSSLATELDKVAALESSIVSQLPIAGHYPHQVPTEQTWTVGLHGLRGPFQPQQFHDSPFWALGMTGVVWNLLRNARAPIGMGNVPSHTLPHGQILSLVLFHKQPWIPGICSHPPAGSGSAKKDTDLALLENLRWKQESSAKNALFKQ